MICGEEAGRLVQSVGSTHPGRYCEIVRTVNKSPHTTYNTTTNMADREDKVYKAKLAEQAERYDGKKLELVEEEWSG